MSKPLTIAYITSLYARASDSYVRAEVAALRDLGHTVHTFSIRRPPQTELLSEAVRAEFDRTDYVLSHGPMALVAAAARRAASKPAAFIRAAVLAVRIGAPGLRGRVWPLAYLLEAAYVAERLERLDAEHLHDHIAEGSASVALLASELSGVPFSVTVHGPGEFDNPRALALHVKGAHAAFLVAISDFARAQLLRWVRPEDWDRVHVVRCGVDKSYLDRAPASLPTGPRLVSIGRLDVQKGQRILLQAVAQLRAEGVTVDLTLVGDGPLRASLEREAKRLGVEESVRFSGWLSAGKVLAQMERARALVMPSLAEGLPIVVMESLALGRPVIATEVGALSELVEPGVSGWLVPAAAVEPLADAIRDVVAAPVGQLERMGAAGAARVRERHDAAREAQRLETLFRGPVTRP